MFYLSFSMSSSLHPIFFLINIPTILQTRVNFWWTSCRNVVLLPCWEGTRWCGRIPVLWVGNGTTKWLTLQCPPYLLTYEQPVVVRRQSRISYRKVVWNDGTKLQPWDWREPIPTRFRLYCTCVYFDLKLVPPPPTTHFLVRWMADSCNQAQLQKYIPYLFILVSIPNSNDHRSTNQFQNQYQ